MTLRGEAAEGGLEILAALAREAQLQALEAAVQQGPRSPAAERAVRMAREASDLLDEAARSGAFRRWTGKSGRPADSRVLPVELRRKTIRLTARLRNRDRE
jgi:hypothetical protein